MKGSVRAKLATFFLILFSAAAVVGVYLLYLRVNGMGTPFNGLFAHHSAEVVSEEEIEAQLTAIGELSTASFEYTDTRTVTDTRQLFGVDIPGTKNKVTITYEGVVKVSYDVEDILVSVDGEEGVICVTLPEPRVTDNYIRFDSIDIESENNILNPISIDNLSAYFGDFREEGIRKAEEMNIWEEAEERMMLLVENFLNVFPEYTVEFVWE